MRSKYKISQIDKTVLGNIYVTIMVDLSEFTGNDELASYLAIAEKDFSYLWIEDGSVVFWNDETKKLGLVYSSNPKDYIKCSVNGTMILSMKR